jgi:hypothetical protein
MIVQELTPAGVAAKIERNKRFLAELFAGPFPGHAIVMDATGNPEASLGDFAIVDEPEERWLKHYVGQYEARARYTEALDDDSVPYVNLNTNTGIFAAAFGCPIHVYAAATNAAARPVVSTAAGADALDEPTLEAPTLRRVFRMAELLREELGPDAPIGVPDIQSPFDVASLVWNKEDFFVALLTDPDAVKRLIGKTLRLLESFLAEFARRIGNVSFCHCPNAWAPAELGVWLSEDEAGSVSCEMFEEFCLPSLVHLSESFGGMFVHCCAAADHQYGQFKKIPNLRALNRVFQAPGPRPAFDAFGSRVFMVAWTSEQDCCKLLELARPETRFLFNMGGMALGEARDVLGRMRERCPRR